MPDLPMVLFPGHVNFQSDEELQKNVRTVVLDQIIKGLTLQRQTKETKQGRESKPGDIVLTGTLEEVNEYFYAREWSDGLPIVPPTTEKVEEFLKYTDRSPDEVIAILLPDNREATIWNIAVNGVMAGCRPEYLPILVAIVEAMANPRFGQEHLSLTPGTETLIVLNGPIIKELGFNYTQGVGRDGFRPNTSIGRFWRLYLRNVAGFLPHKTDKATFGGTWRVVVAENEDCLAKIGWAPLCTDQGIKAGENAVTLSSCTSTDSLANVGAPDPEIILGRLADRVVEISLWVFGIRCQGPALRPQILMSPNVVEALAKAGYSKDKVRQWWFEHALFQAKRFEYFRPDRLLCDSVRDGRLPKLYCESREPERLLPIVSSPEDFQIIVTGDPGKDNALVCCQNGFIGYPVSQRIVLPKKWINLAKSREKTGAKSAIGG